MSWWQLESREYRKILNMFSELELRIKKLEADAVQAEVDIKKLRGRLYQSGADKPEEPEKKAALNNPMFSIH